MTRIQVTLKKTHHVFVSFFCFLNTHVSAFVGGAGESAVVFCGVSAAVSQTGHTDHGGAF